RRGRWLVSLWVPAASGVRGARWNYGVRASPDLDRCRRRRRCRLRLVRRPERGASSSGTTTTTTTTTGGILIGDRLYSEVSLTIDHSLIPEERLSPTPSMQDGLDLPSETDLRILGCELIQAAGILLRLPQVAMATGQVLFHRFFYSKSFVKHSFEIVAMACINLASKIEEAPRRIRDVINVFHHLRQLRGKSDQLHLPKPG
ncbi:mCG8564, isoform CRA_a, partial [Mus musculus]